MDSGGDSPTGAAALALAEQAAGGATAVIGTTSEPHIEKPGEAGTTEDLMQPGAAAEEAREEAAADQDSPARGPDLKNTPGGAKPSEVNADQEGSAPGGPRERRPARSRRRWTRRWAKRPAPPASASIACARR